MELTSESCYEALIKKKVIISMNLICNILLI
jgi:hypothetical protein